MNTSRLGRSISEMSFTIFRMCFNIKIRLLEEDASLLLHVIHLSKYGIFARFQSFTYQVYWSKTTWSYKMNREPWNSSIQLFIREITKTAERMTRKWVFKDTFRFSRTIMSVWISNFSSLSSLAWLIQLFGSSKFIHRWFTVIQDTH